MPTLLLYLGFGLWSLACVLFGAWLEHRKANYQSPLPDFNDRRVFAWLTGRKPPTDGESHTSEEQDAERPREADDESELGATMRL